MKNILKEKLLPRYENLLRKVEDVPNVGVFCAQWGAEYKQGEGMLFVGKATNGCANLKDISVLFDENGEGIFARKDQMTWVTDNEGNTQYNTRKSAFWRVIKGVVIELFTTKLWNEQIAWSNLYKIAPVEKGNPNAKLQKIQRDLCIEILKTEIEVLQPKYVIFLTSGWEWFLVNKLFTDTDIIKTETVKWGKYSTTVKKTNSGIMYIFSPHPQGKKELEHIKAITGVIQSLEE